MKKALILLAFIISFSSCKKDEIKPIVVPEIIEPIPEIRYGYNLDDFNVIQDTIKSGDSFGAILDKHHQ